MLLISCIFLQLIHQPTYALNKNHSEASISLLHVSALGGHQQGVIFNKGVQGQHVYLRIVSPLLKLLKFQNTQN